MSKPTKRGGKAPVGSGAAAATSSDVPDLPPPGPSSTTSGPSRASSTGPASAGPCEVYSTVAGGRSVQQQHAAIPTPRLSRPPSRVPSPTGTAGHVQSEPPADRSLAPPAGERVSFPLAPDVSMKGPRRSAAAEDDKSDEEEEEEMDTQQTKPSPLERVARVLEEVHSVLEKSSDAAIPEDVSLDIARSYAALFDLFADSRWSHLRTSAYSNDTLLEHMERRFNPTPPASEVDATTVREASSAPGTPPPVSTRRRAMLRLRSKRGS